MTQQGNPRQECLVEVRPKLASGRQSLGFFSASARNRIRNCQIIFGVVDADSFCYCNDLYAFKMRFISE